MPFTTLQVLLNLPPILGLSDSGKARLRRTGFLNVHFIIVGGLYSIVLLAAAIEGTLLISGGIGILQNPPFLAHLIGGVLSAFLPYIISKRIINIAVSPEDEKIVLVFMANLRAGKAKQVFFNLAFLVGVVSLAYTVSMSLTPHIKIFDAITYPITFTAYFLLRVYLYLVCYPLMIAGSITLVYYLFGALRTDVAEYSPFHYDEAGGLRKYFLAVDRPVYTIQSLAVLVALMNYLGWRGLQKVPVMLALAVPVIATLFAFFLLYRFYSMLSFKRRREIQAIRTQEMLLYPGPKTFASLPPRECLELLERIAALERLIETIKKARPRGWQKYLFNLVLATVTKFAAPLGASLVARLGLPLG